jgi:type I restriction enzyme M protein
MQRPNKVHKEIEIMLDTQTKKRIDDCRDILVGKLPDPKAQIEQITIGLIYKFMDDMDKEAIELGGSAKFFSGDYEKYAWDKLFDTKVTAAEMLRLYSEAIESMEKNPNIPQLFRDIFNNAYLPYRDPETLKMFLKTIGEFEYTHSEKLGDAFEYLLSVMGSQGDAGQFRTPRHVIDFLVAIVDPDKGETILDPACGTAGFLISAYKHILLKYSKKFDGNGKRAAIADSNRTDVASNRTDVARNVPRDTISNIYQYNQLPDSEKFSVKGDLLTPDDRKKLIQNFAGYDISPDMVRLSLVNLYLHGFSDPHINEYDTLSSEDRWNENFDVVLANPPFMSPKGGIRPHKKFTIASNRSEVLFVDYIAEHLNPKGKAGIIVPEGVIFQSGTAYKDLRKMLVENYLYAVVSLPAGVFNPYSGVKTSILLMDKAIAKQRNEILFIKIDNDGYNLGAQRAAVKGSQLEEAIKIIHDFAANDRDAKSCVSSISSSTIAHTVPKTEIAANGDCNLSGDRYKVIDAAISEFEIVNLSEVAELQGGYAFKSSELKSEKGDADLPVIKIGNLSKEGNLELDGLQYFPFEESLSRYLIDKKDVLIAMTGATVGKTAVSEYDNLLLNQRVGLVRTSSSKLNRAYLSNLLLHEKFYNYCQRTAGGGAQGNISPKEILNFQIPLPPLSIQEEIVEEIEGYRNIIDGAKAVVANYKPKIDIYPDWEMVELGEVCEVKSGGTPSRQIESYWNGNIPWVGSTVCKDTYVNSAEEFITNEGLKSSSAKLFEEGTTLIALVGATIGKTGFLTFKSTTNQNIAGLTPKDETNLDKKYLYFSCQSIYNNFMRLGEGKFRMATLSFVREQKIALPSIDIQRQIVSQIEKEQALVNANKQLIEIFEQKIKDRIAKVWGEKEMQDFASPKVSMAAEPVAEYKAKTSV